MVKLCRRDKHPVIPENRTIDRRCRLCVLDRRQERRERMDAMRHAKRARDDREQTKLNVALRSNKSLSDDTAREHARAGSIFKLMDSLELARNRRERLDIQSRINHLSNVNQP